MRRALLCTVVFWPGLLLLATGVPSDYSGADEFALLAKVDFENGRADGWRPRDPAHWRIAGTEGNKFYELTAPGEPGPVRAPTSWSLLAGLDVSAFELSGRFQCDTDPANNKRDMCVFFGFQDPTHFYYVHFAGSSDDVHNIIGLVNGADRVKINLEPAGQSVFRLTDKGWHTFKVTMDASTGEIRAYLDDKTKPILTGRDRTLNYGLVGIGSFDDTGRFDDLELRGELFKSYLGAAQNIFNKMF
jgi:hypothetical protein